MLLTDKKIIEKLKIKPDDKVLDIGGSMRQHEVIKVDILADIIPPEEAPYWPSNLLAKRFVKVDITKSKLPFKDKEFDVCLCTHTLEDLPNPFMVIDEMSRVAKRGLIVTPSMGQDMTFLPIDYTDWLTGARRVPGHAHHKWFFIIKNNILRIIPKNFPVLYTRDFNITKWDGEAEMVYVWKGAIKYNEFASLSIHDLIEEYENFVKTNSKKIKNGRVLFFIDNPLNILKAFAKILLHKGEGYVSRKTGKR